MARVPFDILVVCTANICRSPTAARGLSSALAAAGLADLVSVSSAGVQAADGMAMCPTADELSASALGLESDGEAHASRRIAQVQVARADLILTADRDHRRAVLEVDPTARQRVFTLRQAARLAQWIVESGTADIAERRAGGRPVDLDPLDPRAAVPALPDDPGDRLRWFVGELDAARGLAPRPALLQPVDWDADDVGDPHRQGTHRHPEAVTAVLSATAALIQALGYLIGMPYPEGHPRPEWVSGHVDS